MKWTKRNKEIMEEILDTIMFPALESEEEGHQACIYLDFLVDEDDETGEQTLLRDLLEELRK